MQRALRDVRTLAKANAGVSASWEGQRWMGGEVDLHEDQGDHRNTGYPPSLGEAEAVQHDAPF